MSPGTRKRISYFYVGILFLLMLAGCRKSLSPNEYKAWVENPENGYVQTVNNGNTAIKVLMQPKQYSAAQLYYNSQGEYASLKEAENAIGNHVYFKVQIQGESKELDFFKNYIFFNMERDIYLLTDGDSIPPSYYLAEPLNGVSPYQIVVVGFPEEFVSGEKVDLRISPSALFPEGAALLFEKMNVNIPNLKEK